MAFAENLDDFLDTTHGFAVAATYQGASTVNGIFDNEYFEDTVGQGAGAESTRPVFVCKASDVPTVAHGHTLLIGATTYHVIAVEPDGQGMTRLVLEKQ